MIYTTEEDNLVSFRDPEPFEIDGIVYLDPRYQFWSCNASVTIRPMIEVIPTESDHINYDEETGTCDCFGG